MRWQLDADLGAFARRVGPLLEARIVNNVVATVVAGTVEGQYRTSSPVLALARSRGYASSAVAAVSRHALATGAHTCMLYTDLANPTSNKIYADVGYRRIAEWEERVFT
jgi:RimJ/RimL family protein N-acetyltransferase